MTFQGPFRGNPSQTTAGQGVKTGIVRFKKSSSLKRGSKNSKKIPALRAQQNAPILE
jgi:hypothetical protein